MSWVHRPITDMAAKIEPHQRGVPIDHWGWERRQDVRMWLVKNFGAHGDRWYEQNDLGLEDLIMDQDVYQWYMLRWA